MKILKRLNNLKRAFTIIKADTKIIDVDGATLIIQKNRDDVDFKHIATKFFQTAFHLPR